MKFGSVGVVIAALLSGVVGVDQAAHAGWVSLADTMTDFAGTQGSGGFTYGYYTTFGSPATFSTSGMNFETEGGVDYWQGPYNWPHASAPDDFPFIDSISQHPISVSNPGSIGGAANASAVRRFTASMLSAPTLVHISTVYWDEDLRGGDSQIVRIWVDGILSLEHDLAGTGGAMQNSEFSVLLTPTSIVDFEVDPKAGFLHDRTVLRASLFKEVVDSPPAEVPEPSSFALLAAGGLVFAGVRKVRRTANRVDHP